MMRRLIWKELRENCWSILLLLASAVIITLCGTSVLPGMGLSGETPWIVLVVLLALKVGAGAFASELGAGTADFLYSRPARWTGVLAAKTLVGALGVTGVVVLTAVLFRVWADSQYAALLTQKVLVQSTVLMLVVTAVAYLVGLAAAAALPGTMGSLLTLSAAVMFAVIVTFAQETWQRHTGTYATEPAFIFGGALAGALIALVVVTRFGLTVSNVYRGKIYAICVAVCTLVGSALPFHPGQTYPESTAVSPSPDGKYMLINDNLFDRSGRRISWEGVQLGGSPTSRGVHWTAASVACWAVGRDIFILDAHERTAQIAMLSANVSEIRLSPDGRYAAVEISGSDGVVSEVRFIDLRAAEVVGEPLRLPRGATIWWQSGSRLGYLADDGSRQFADLP